MDVQTQAVFDAALALPVPERALLARQLLDTLEPGDADASDEQLFAELNRRRAEVAQGTASSVPWSELSQEE
jgi:putative addiction module component (TIGR02574 family)